MKNQMGDSFCVPNSIIQGLITATPTGLNRISAFSTTLLLGLTTLVNPKTPHEEVCARPSDLLEIIQVSKAVDHAVTRCWQTSAGIEQEKIYEAKRYSPRRNRTRFRD